MMDSLKHNIYLSNVVIDEFGSLQNASLGPLKPRLNVVFGKNETGKSTFAQFIEGIISGWLPNRSTLNSYLSPKKVRSGHLEFTDNNGKVHNFMRTEMPNSSKIWDLDDDFPKDRQTFELVNMITSQSLMMLDKDSRIGQLSAAGAATRVSPQAAIDNLENEIKCYSSKKSGNEKSLVLLQQEIISLSQSIQSQSAYIEQISSVATGNEQSQDEYKDLLSRQKFITKRIQNLNDLISKINSINSLKSEINQLENQLHQIQIKVAKIEAKIEVLTSDYENLKNKINTSKQSSSSSTDLKRRIVGFGIFAVAAIFSGILCILSQYIAGGVVFAAGIVFLIVYFLIINSQKSKKEQNNSDFNNMVSSKNDLQKSIQDMEDELNHVNSERIMIETKLSERKNRLSEAKQVIDSVLQQNNLEPDSNEREISRLIMNLEEQYDEVQKSIEQSIAEREKHRHIINEIGSKREDLSASENKLNGLLQTKKQLTIELIQKITTLDILKRANASWLKVGGYNSNKVAAKYLEIMTCGKWDKIDPKTFDVSSSKTGQCLPVKKLSRSTTQQLYLAVRMSILQSPECLHKQTPVICDDILVDFDLQRQEMAMKALSNLSDYRQIIMFTARTSTAQIAQNLPNCNLLYL